jgi:hypothetical protein
VSTLAHVVRGGALLAAAFTLALTPAVAAGQVAPPPDLMIVSRGGAVLTGDDISNDDGVGQQRSVIVDSSVELRVRIENEGSDRQSLLVEVPILPDGFELSIRWPNQDFLEGLTKAQPPDRIRFALDVAGGARRTLRVRISVDPSAPLGASTPALVTVMDAANPSAVLDAVLLKITKTSTPT